MSDGCTDARRDQERGERYEQWLNALKSYLLKPTGKTFNAAIEAAKHCDAFKLRGYHSGSTAVSRSVMGNLLKLKDGDKNAWVTLLAEVMDAEFFSEFKALSPFAANIILRVEYGCGFSNLPPGLEELMRHVIDKEHNMKVRDGDDYLVILPPIDAKEVGVHWLKCGILGQKGPRKARE